MMNQYGLTAEQVRNQFLYVGGSAAELDVMEYGEGTNYLAEQIKDWDLVIVDGVSASLGDLDGDWDGNKDVDYTKWHKIMEIGRATCTESVCKYVSNMVVAGAFIKKATLK